LKSAAGHPVLHFERIDSTNSEARRLAEQDEYGPLWLVADRQDGGRGRLGRTWVSEPGNLYATFLFPISAGPEIAAQAGLVAAVAVQAAVSRLRPDLAVRIKWPNDLLIGGAKVCGILSEVVGTAPTRIALGCGINVAHAPTDTPYPATALGPRCTVESVFEELDSSLSNCLKIWDEGQGFGAIRAAWSAAALGIGGQVAASIAGEATSGIFAGIAPDGALLLQTGDGRLRPVHSGEVRFAALEELRQA
jgi:BirA family biotin operon repressor/biotin-[acetyl-CoA-carboxylase] ligase